jgi:hypothetical protein
MNTNQENNTISVSFAKEAVDTIDAFLHRRARKKFKTIEDAAQGMMSVWKKLEFSQGDIVSAEWQQSGIAVLGRIISGELKGFDAEDHMHGVNGMFNQTFRSAVNVA